MPCRGTGFTAHALGQSVRKRDCALPGQPAPMLRFVQRFALFHDSRRINEGVDDGHGFCGAELAATLRGVAFDLSDEDFALLYAACAGHTDGLTVGDITVQTCWDADRLDLGRVGIVPEPRRLCTHPARESAILKWADGRAAFRIVPEIVAKDWGLDVKDWDTMA